MPSAAMKQTIDPQRKVILDKLGDVPGLDLAQNELLVAIYRRDEMSPGGIIRVAQTLAEDVYQGKVGLIVKIGENFNYKWTDPYTARNGGIPVKLHDWIFFRTSDTWALEVNVRQGMFKKEDFVVCRTVEAKHIRGVVEHPDQIW
jgi:hypothetical protein